MNRIKKLFAFMLFLSGVAFTFSQEVVEAIVAIVNDGIITLSQFKQQNELLYQTLRSQFEGEEFNRRYDLLSKELLNTMITDLLLLQEARKKNLDVSEPLKMTIENMKKEYGFESDEQLRRALEQQGIAFEDWRRQQEEFLLKQNVIFYEVGRNIVIDDSEIVNYYKQHPEEFNEPAEFKLRAIYLSSEGKGAEELQAKMKEVDIKIAAGEDFAGLAGVYSEGPGKESQGDLGSFKKGELEGVLEQAVQDLKVGKVSDWVHFRDGWYLLRLEDRKESRLKTFDEVREEVEEKISEEQRQKKLGEYLENLKKRSYIKILIPNPLEY